MQVPMHVLDALTIHENDDNSVSKIVSFIEKYFISMLPDETSNPDLHQLVKIAETCFHTVFMSI